MKRLQNSRGRESRRRGASPKAKESPQGSSPKIIWSLRSQKSLKRQYELEGQIGKFEGLIAFEQGRLKDAEANRLRQAKMVADDQYVFMRNLEDTFADIDQRKKKISTYQELIAGRRAEIEASKPSPSQAAERARKQAELARLATERVTKDAWIDAMIEKLRAALASREELTAAMVTLATEIDFSGENFDSARFDALEAALPAAMQLESKRWLTWFFGEEADRCPYELRRGSIVTFAETLAAANIFRQGETPLLTEKQRAELDYVPPRPLTTVEFEALHYAPKKPGDEIDARSFPGNDMIFPQG